ncbi:glycosyltransferase 87 family protein [Lentzea sp. NPDC006480]|uniref:glycosyltransferase 87 family protein n=1 Tax=Lentzea sp. NPDC006480 TaxID=3157176 RepID=UPI0033A6A71D
MLDHLRSSWRGVLYLAFAGFALITAMSSEFFGYRVWGMFAVVAFLGAGAFAVFNDRLAIWFALLLGSVAPLGVLIFNRNAAAEDFSGTPWTWSAQPDVWVIERSARLLLAHGTPYVDVTALGRAPDVNDYTPYGPLMTVFGLPRALFGDSPLTDARIMFALVAVAAVVLSLKLLNWPRIPVLAAQLAAASPLTMLTITTSGEDVAVLALIVLTATLVITRRHGWAAVVAAAVVSIKLIALPAIVVLVLFMLGRKHIALFAAVLAGLNLPVFLVDPTAFVEHAIRFPTGGAEVTSPASSPFPGHLLTELGPAGHVTALALLVVAGLAVVVWLLVRRPATVANALWRVVAGMGAAILLMPASRFGYLVYPAALIGSAVFFSSVERVRAPRSTTATTTRVTSANAG